MHNKYLNVLGGLGVVTYIIEKWFVWNGVKKIVPIDYTNNYVREIND
jgi:hypothetical protein